MDETCRGVAGLAPSECASSCENESQSGTNRREVSGRGFAIDFHGAITRFGKFDVFDDWGKQPITLPNGKTVPKWPPGTWPHFRLDVDTKAGGFFYDVYHWLTGEAADARGKRTSIGDHSYILCPDMPDVTWRESHQDHIHCEIDR